VRATSGHAHRKDVVVVQRLDAPGQGLVVKLMWPRAPMWPLPQVYTCP
jgi:hypothetical protein